MPSYFPQQPRIESRLQRSRTGYNLKNLQAINLPVLNIGVAKIPRLINPSQFPMGAANFSSEVRTYKQYCNGVLKFSLLFQ